MRWTSRRAEKKQAARDKAAEALHFFRAPHWEFALFPTRVKRPNGTETWVWLEWIGACYPEAIYWLRGDLRLGKGRHWLPEDCHPQAVADWLRR